MNQEAYRDAHVRVAAEVAGALMAKGRLPVSDEMLAEIAQAAADVADAVMTKIAARKPEDWR